MLEYLLYELLDSTAPECTNEHVDRMLKYIDEHIQDPTLSNTQLAKRIGISEVYLRKLFQSHYHTTPRQYILELRIRKAKQLLASSRLSISQVAEHCGFTNPYHFSRAFRQATQRTPSEYRTENQII